MQEQESAVALVVQTTVATAEDAAALARHLVQKRVAACVQVWPVTSTYTWKGVVEVASEHVVAAKTTPQGYAALEAEVRAVHRYEQPEIVALPVTRASEGYLVWLRDSTRQH